MEDLHSRTDVAISMAEVGYIRYLAGVAILNNPEATAELHHEAVGPNGVESMLVRANHLMLDGLKAVVRFSDPSDYERPLSEYEQCYATRFARMKAVVDRTHSKENERIYDLSPPLFWLRPAAMLHEPVYKYICHGRSGKLTTERLMDGVPAHPVFAGKAALRGLAR